MSNKNSNNVDNLSKLATCAEANITSNQIAEHVNIKETFIEML